MSARGPAAARPSATPPPPPERTRGSGARPRRRTAKTRRLPGLGRRRAGGAPPDAEIRDWEDYPVAEAVERERDIVGGDEQARLDHVLDRHLLGAEVLLEGKALRRRVTQAEGQLRRRIDAAVGEIAARPRA